MKELVDQIMPKILSLQNQAKSQLPILETELSYSINTRSQDGHRIGLLLDSFCSELEKHNSSNYWRYYKTVDQEGAANYWRYYEEMLAEEDVERAGRRFRSS